MRKWMDGWMGEKKERKKFKWCRTYFFNFKISNLIYLAEEKHEG